MLLLEPYFAGSHAAWADGYAAHSGLDVHVASMPGRFWKWRMHGASVTLARRVAEYRPRVLLCSDMLDVASFLGLARPLRSTPVVLYMHENQLAYPEAPDDSSWTSSRRRRAARRDAHYAFVNVTSALASDVVVWNSRHNRDSFLEALPTFLGSFPDARELGAVSTIAERSEVLPVGIDVAGLQAARPESRVPGPARILWNHRWEHDKGPGAFVAALEALDRRGAAFEVIVLGESFSRRPDAFDALAPMLGDRLLQIGYAEDRGAYARWLWHADIVVSTARHEFFGVSVVEAMICGCRPVLPDRLSYPELVPASLHRHVLYPDFEGLVSRLAEACGAARPSHRVFRDHAARYDWRALAPRYDDLLEHVATARRHRTRGDDDA